MAEAIIRTRARPVTGLAKKKSLESYAHKAAKDVLSGWLREAAEKAGQDEYAHVADFFWRVNRGPPHFGIWTEYPILEDGYGADQVWNEIDPQYEVRVPTFRELIKERHEAPAVILDVAVQHKGGLIAAFEIFHRHATSLEKRLFLDSIGVHLIELPARWILSQVGTPRRIPRDFVSCGAA